MVDALEKARKAIEGTYYGRATVRVMEKAKDKTSGLSKNTETVVIKDEPCRVSFKSIYATSQTESVDKVTQQAVLFISPDITIPPGSKVTVAQLGSVTEYSCSGQPAAYKTHQEIMLTIFRGYA